MPTIETIARPVRNRISVEIPQRYHAYSFRVVLVPIAPVSDRVIEFGADEIDPRVRSLVGAFKLPPEEAGRSDKELLYEALVEKYGL